MHSEYRASNGPTEAINGPAQSLGRHALGFPNLMSLPSPPVRGSI
nr:hypothetical protein [Rhodococcus sp. ZPP]